MCNANYNGMLAVAAVEIICENYKQYLQLDSDSIVMK
jgi:hypothetical protein